MSAYNDLSPEELLARFKKSMDMLTEFNNKYSKEGKDMKTDNDKMLRLAKFAVVAWWNDHNGPARISLDDVFIVWFCKTLQNWKALCGTTHSDGMYYEVTYDGDKGNVYLDAYKKWDNHQYTGGELF